MNFKSITNIFKSNPKKLIQNEKHHQIRRLKQDAMAWRGWLLESEMSWNPYRVKMQNGYMDTVLDPHISACMTKRKNLTLLKDYSIVNEAGEPDEKLTTLFKSEWFSLIINYVLDAQFYGYSLINWTEVNNDRLKFIEVIKRQLVSPDRKTVSQYEYIPYGTEFDSDEFKDWCLYVSTPSENGSSKCGIGLLYKVALSEIFLRMLTGGNADYVEIFGQPYRWGKTSSTGEERDKLEQSLRDMGASNYIVTDPMDEIEFLEAGSKGKGYESFDNFEARLHKKISKALLGHADAIDSTPGKLGGQNESVEAALREIEATDNTFVENVINESLFPKLRNLGFIIPEGYKLKYSNDKEEQQATLKKDESNKLFTDYVKTLSDAGFDVDAKDIEERTGLKVVKKPEPKPVTAPGKKKDVKVFNKLVDDLYFTNTCKH